MRKIISCLSAIFAFLASVSISSCSSSDETEIPKSELVEVDSPYTMMKKKVFALFGLDTEDSDKFHFKGYESNPNLSLAAIKKSSNKLVFAVYDTIQSKMLVYDSSFVAQPHVYEAYYDQTRDYSLENVSGNFLSVNGGGVGVVSMIYVNNASSYRNFLYFLDNGNLVKKDSLDMPSNDIGNLMVWEDNKVLVQYKIDEGYKNIVYDLKGNEVTNFTNKESLADYSFIKLQPSDFVQYRFCVDYLYVSRKAIENNSLITKWKDDYIKYPEGFDTYKMSITYSVSPTQLTFNVTTLCKNGKTRRYVVKVDLETGKYSFEELA